MTRIEQYGFRGYCVHQPFNGLRMPVPAQNILLRDYAGRHGLMFKLSVNELDFPNCDVQLFGLLADLDQLQGILMASLFMLPGDGAARQRFYQQVLAAGAAVHFVMENTAMHTPEDVERIEDLFRMARLLAYCPRTIETGLLAANLGGDPGFSVPPAACP